jgi:hypothetical protein
MTFLLSVYPNEYYSQAVYAEAFENEHALISEMSFFRGRSARDILVVKKLAKTGYYVIKRNGDGIEAIVPTLVLRDMWLDHLYWSYAQRNFPVIPSFHTIAYDEPNEFPPMNTALLSLPWWFRLQSNQYA